MPQIDLLPLDLRAAVASINEDARTVDLTFSTGAAVDRIDWGTGKRYREVLSMKAEHVRLERLNSGASLLNSHASTNLADVIGAVVPSTARIEQGQGLATVRFSRRADVEPYFQDVKDGIIKFVSVGYRVHKFMEDAGRDGALPTRTAVDWEPFEISMVAMPADAAAKVRAEAGAPLNSCLVIVRDLATEDADRVRRFRLAMARAV